MNRLAFTSVFLLFVAGCSLRMPADLDTTKEVDEPASVVAGSLTVMVRPADAVLRVGGQPAAPGTALNLDPGEYELELERLGYERKVASVELGAGEEKQLELILQPLAQELLLDSFPGGAKVRVLSGQEVVAAGQAPLRAVLPSGPLQLEFVLEGFETAQRSLFLDAPLEHRECLDRPGQLLDCQWEAGGVRSPKAVAYSPDGRELWATQLNNAPALRAYDAATGEQLGQVEFGEKGAVELVFAPDGSKIYASQMDTATVYEVDPVAREVLRSFRTRSTWTKIVELSADGSSLFASNWIGNDVSEIDLESGLRARRLPTAKTPRGLWATPDGERLYVASFGSGKLERIDLRSGRRRTLYQGGVLRHLEPDLERGRLYISDMRQDKIFVMDMATEKVTQLARTERHPNTITLSPDGRLLFVSCRGRNNPENWMAKGPQWGTLLVLDAIDGELLDVVVAGNQPTALDVSPDGRSLVLSDILDNRLRSYAIPPYDELKAGGGGLRDSYKSMLRKR